jgi:hypothetical protein
MELYKANFKNKILNIKNNLGLSISDVEYNTLIAVSDILIDLEKEDNIYTGICDEVIYKTIATLILNKGE